MEDEENQGPELSEKISEEWQKFVNKNQATQTFLQNNQKKMIQAEGNAQIVLFFNKNLDINRFFVEDSDGNKANAGGGATGNEMPQIEGSAGMNGGTGLPASGFAYNSDPFEDDLEDALCVFKAGDSNKDIMEKNEKLIMFYVDLENEQILNSNEENKNGGEEDQEQVGDSKHPVLLNQYPLSMGHSIMLLFANAGLP